MSRVHIRPAGAEIEIGEGETLMNAALRSGYRWPTVCGGQGNCTTCFVQIRKGLDRVVGPDVAEEAALELLRLRFARNPESVRLACQLKFKGGDVEVYRPGVRPLT